MNVLIGLGSTSDAAGSGTEGVGSSTEDVGEEGVLSGGLGTGYVGAPCWPESTPIHHLIGFCLNRYPCLRVGHSGALASSRFVANLFSQLRFASFGF